MELPLQQEPGDDETIQEFVTEKFGVTFPVSIYDGLSVWPCASSPDGVPAM
jgi:hypothetical protein